MKPYALFFKALIIFSLIIYSCKDKKENIAPEGSEREKDYKLKLDKSKIDTLLNNEDYTLLYYNDPGNANKLLDMDSTHQASGLFLVKKPQKQMAVAPAAKKVDIDTSEVTANIANYINANGGRLKQLDFIDFDLGGMLYYLKKSSEVGVLGKIPDSVRAYVQRYSGSHARYANKNSVTFVVINGGKDLFHNGYEDTRPINLGRLCPPDCEDIYPRTARAKNDTGAILYRAGAQKSRYPL